MYFTQKEIFIIIVIFIFLDCGMVVDVFCFSMLRMMGIWVILYASRMDVDGCGWIKPLTKGNVRNLYPCRLEVGGGGGEKPVGWGRVRAARMMSPQLPESHTTLARVRPCGGPTWQWANHRWPDWVPAATWRVRGGPAARNRRAGGFSGAFFFFLSEIIIFWSLTLLILFKCRKKYYK